MAGSSEIDCFIITGNVLKVQLWLAVLVISEVPLENIGALQATGLKPIRPVFIRTNNRAFLSLRTKGIHLELSGRHPFCPYASLPPLFSPPLAHLLGLFAPLSKSQPIPPPPLLTATPHWLRDFCAMRFASRPDWIFSTGQAAAESAASA